MNVYTDRLVSEMTEYEGGEKKLHQDKREFGKLACNLKDGPYYR